MDSKSIFASKTLWANLLGPVFLWLAAKGFALSPDDQAALITVIMMAANILLRLVTSQPVHITAPTTTTLKSFAAYFVAVTLIALTLVACSSAPSSTASGTPAAASDPISQLDQALAKIGTFTVTDLQNADKEAVAANDAEAHACFPALIQFVQSLPAAAGTQTVSGAFSAFELARATRLQVQGAAAAGVPTYLKMGCSALVLDEQTFVLKLAALAGVTTAAAPVLPALAPVLAP